MTLPEWDFDDPRMEGPDDAEKELVAAGLELLELFVFHRNFFQSWRLGMIEHVGTITQRTVLRTSLDACEQALKKIEEAEGAVGKLNAYWQTMKEAAEQDMDDLG